MNPFDSLLVAGVVVETVLVAVALVSIVIAYRSLFR